MKSQPHPRSILLGILLATLASACGASTPTGVDTDDVRGTWNGTFDAFALMGRTLSGDADWTFNRDTFEIIFFNPPEGQAERIQGDWKFANGKMALELKSSFPIDTDAGATDTLFVSILRDEMSLKTITDSSIRLVKTRLTSVGVDQSSGHRASASSPFIRDELSQEKRRDTPPVTEILTRRFNRADIRITIPQHPPA